MRIYRDCARAVLNRFNADIRGMENFGARTQKPLDTCLEEVKSSELFIGIIGMRYGSVDRNTGKSYVEREYETAIKSKLEIKIYMIDEKNAHIPPMNVECKNVEKLNKFKKKLRKDHTCVDFSSELDLSEKIQGDLKKYFFERIGEPTISRAFVSGTVNSATIAKGDDGFIIGTATETQFSGVAIWFFAQNYFNYFVVDVQPDDSYILQIPSILTKQMPAGQYFVVIQHPMTNGRFDVIPCVSTGSLIVKNSFNNETFAVQGPNSIMGIDAATNVIEFINKTTIDDTYTKLQFLIEDPVIRINSIENRKPGDKFTISGITNIAVDNEIFIEVMPGQISPDFNSHFGIKGIIRVVKGVEGYNALSFDIDLATAQPGDYVINAISYKLGIVASQVFKVE
jgi:hypothetical protein